MNGEKPNGDRQEEPSEEYRARGPSLSHRMKCAARVGLGEILNTIDEPQKWLNQDQEWAYSEFSRMLREMGDDEAREWIAELFHDAVMEERGTPLQKSELRSMVIRFEHGNSASRIAGTSITRPVFHFSDISEFQNFSAAWRGPAGVASRGMSMEIQTLNGTVSLLFSCGPLHASEDALPSNALRIGSAEEYIEHEITHSIDPNLHRRTGYDQVLCEALAYYDTIIANPTGPVKGPNWGFYEQTLKSHFENWSAGDTTQIWDLDEYNSTCAALVDSIREARQSLRDVEIQRRLAKSLHVKDFITSCIKIQ